MLEITISTISWLNGFSALALVCAAFIFAFDSAHLYRKTKKKVFISGSILGFAVAFGWMGITLSFLSVLQYGYNVSGIKQIIPYFSYSTIPVGSIATLSIAWDLLMPPEHKKKVLIAVGIFCVFYYIVLYMTFSSAVVCPNVEPGEIYDDWLAAGSLPYYLVYALVLGNTVIFAIGIMRFFKAVTGELRQRAMWIIIATPIIGTAILLDTVVITADIFQEFLFIIRFLMIPTFYFLYKGFKPPEE